MPAITDPNVLVGTATADDAAVYRVSDDVAVIETLDFFTPIVDDPYMFGAIAAANSLSDVYAMGGKPVLALNIVAFPRDSAQTPIWVLNEILKGGSDKAAEAGISIVGGHTIDDPGPKYGLSVTGLVHPDRIWRNTGAKPGDRILLEGEGGEKRSAWIKEITPDSVIVDLNHPYAGRRLRYEVFVMDVRDATPEERETGRVYRPG